MNEVCQSWRSCRKPFLQETMDSRHGPTKLRLKRPRPQLNGCQLTHDKIKFRTPERWQSGRMRRFAKPLYGLTPVPRVRIPPSPPLTQEWVLSYYYCTERFGRASLSGAQVEH